MPMNYEFYFLRSTGLLGPELLRVIAPSYENAATIVARQFGWATAIDDNRRPVRDYIESIDIRPVEIQNLFEPSLFP